MTHILRHLTDVYYKSYLEHSDHVAYNDQNLTFFSRDTKDVYIKAVNWRLLYVIFTAFWSHGIIMTKIRRLFDVIRHLVVAWAAVACNTFPLLEEHPSSSSRSSQNSSFSMISNNSFSFNGLFAILKNTYL